MRIVIIDDVVGINQLKTQFQKINIRCDVVGVASDYEEGSRIVIEKSPDVIFMNFHLEDKQGERILRRLRSKFVFCTVVAIMKDREQKLEQEIINLKVCGCVAKPFDVADLRAVVEQARMDMELIHNKSILYSLDHIMMEAVYGELSLTPKLRKYILERYDLSKNDILGIVGVWLGKDYATYAKQVGKGLESISWGEQKLRSQLVYLPGSKMVIMVLYPLQSQTIYSMLQHKVATEMQAFLPEKCILVAERCYGIENMQSVLIKMGTELEWNLVLGRSVLINQEILRSIRTTELVYPAELDAQVEQAVAKGSRVEFEMCFKHLMEICRKEIHTPYMIKAVCLQYCWMVIHLGKTYNDVERDVSAQNIIAAVSQAVYWEEIWGVLIVFSKKMLMPVVSIDSNYSILVVRARQMIEEFYSTGITLEEVAARLHVTTEYMSSLYKRETGITFSETIRNYRVEKIKDYLSESAYSITKIAEKTGYSDPKYMSKVFKEVVGVRPTDYRKLNNIK